MTGEHIDALDVLVSRAYCIDSLGHEKCPDNLSPSVTLLLSKLHFLASNLPSLWSATNLVTLVFGDTKRLMGIDSTARHLQHTKEHLLLQTRR